MKRPSYPYRLLINPNLEYSKIWLLCFAILIYMGWSMINIPYLTWSSEISLKYEDKTILNSSRELFTILGVLIALLVPYILNLSQNPQKTLDILFITFLLLFFPLFFINYTGSISSLGNFWKWIRRIFLFIWNRREFSINF